MALSTFGSFHIINVPVKKKLWCVHAVLSGLTVLYLCQNCKWINTPCTLQDITQQSHLLQP